MSVLCIGGRRWYVTGLGHDNITYSYFQFLPQVCFSHHEIIVNFRINYSAQRKLKSRIFVLKCCYFVTKFSNLFQHTTASICGEFMHECVVFCTACTMSSYERLRNPIATLLTLTLSLISWRSNTVVLPCYLSHSYSI